MRHSTAWIAGLAVGGICLIVYPGCGNSPSNVTDASSANGTAESSRKSAPFSPTQELGEPIEKTAPRKIRDTWEVYSLQGRRIGYGHTTVTRETESGGEVVITEGVNHIVIQRDGQKTEREIGTKSIETPKGQLIRFESRTRMGPTPITMVGQVRGDRLELEIVGPGAAAAKRDSVQWSANFRGPFAVEQTLLERPLNPGEKREVKMLMPGPTGVEVVTVEMTANSFEDTPCIDRSRNLLRIETITRLPGGLKIDSTVWTDRTGDMLKNVTAGLEQHRATEAEALEKHDVAELDIMSTMNVKVERPLPDAHHSKRIRYRVYLDGGDPASVFATGASQTVKPLDAHTAEITVYAMRPGVDAGNEAAATDPPSQDDLRPNSFIQSDDPTIVANARKAAGDETDPWRVAVALERYVNREINVTDGVKQKNFTQAFASAAEVAKSREGDCTEHGVFLAALARARGIPARVAIGLVYMQRAGAFGYHMWTEVHINKRWIPIDGTLALGGIGAAHLKITHSNLQAASAYNAFLPVVQILGRLRIEVIDAQ